MNITLQIAKQTIMNSNLGINVATNNMANAHDANYSKQSIDFRSGLSIKQGNNLLSTGAYAAAVYRNRTGVYDNQYRSALNDFSFNNSMAEALVQVETFLGTMDSATGLKASFTEFYNSLQELSKHPENLGIKASVKDTAVGLSNTLRLLNKNITSMKHQYALLAEKKVLEVNEMLKSIQNLNDEIGRLTITGENPNSLLDSRDKLIDSLSSIMDITVVPTDNNRVSIVSNGQTLVTEGYHTSLTASIGNGYSIDIKYANGTDFSSKGGELGALDNLVTNKFDSILGELDFITKTFIDNFNQVHKQGVLSDGSNAGNFFDGDSTDTIKVSDAILNDAGKISVSTTTNSGDNKLVLDLIKIFDEKLINGQYSIMNSLDCILSGIATETKTIMNKAENYSSVVDEIFSLRSSEMGVNTNEELLNVQQFSQTFAAASKVIQTLNEMMDALFGAI